jgi:hypothetical protein
MLHMLQHTCPRPSKVRMKILLDENFPLALVRKLREQGHEVEHLILLGLRGTPDSMIVARLNSETLLFLTHDQEFLQLEPTRSSVIISRVSQSLPLSSRIEAWLTGSASISRMTGASASLGYLTMEGSCLRKLWARTVEKLERAISLIQNANDHTLAPFA